MKCIFNTVFNASFYINCVILHTFQVIRGYKKNRISTYVEDNGKDYHAKVYKKNRISTYVEPGASQPRSDVYKKNRISTYVE